MTYEIINSAGIVLGSFDLSFVSEAAIAGGGILQITSTNTIDVTGNEANTVIEVKDNVFLPFSFVDLPEEGDL
jgi:hypothetical protein